MAVAEDQLMRALIEGPTKLPNAGVPWASVARIELNTTSSPSDRTLGIRSSESVFSSRTGVGGGSHAGPDGPLVFAHVYAGTYRQEDATLFFQFGGSESFATGTLDGPQLEVRYSDMMHQADFEDAVYRLSQKATVHDAVAASTGHATASRRRRAPTSSRAAMRTPET